MSKVDISVVLDRSGSMSTIWDDTIGGINTFIKQQQEAEGEATFTLVGFDDAYDVIIPTKDVKHVSPLTGKEVHPRGMTALLDAVGKTIVHLDENKTSEDVIVVVVTDGWENSSVEYKGDTIKSLIEAREEAGWKFIFLGANQDSWSVGTSLGMRGNRTRDWNHTNVGATYAATGQSIATYRGTQNVADLNQQ